MTNKNILASSRKIRQKRKMVKLAGYGLSILLLFILIVSIFYIPHLRIKEIDVGGVVEGNEKILLLWLAGAIEGKRFGILPYNNIIIFPKESMEAGVIEAFPEIKEFNIKRVSLSKIEATGKERKAVGLWCNKKDNCGFVDESGFVYKQAPTFSGNLFLKFYKFGSEEALDVKKGFQAISENEFKNLVKFVGFVSENGVKINKVFMEEQGQYRFETTAGWHIILNQKNEIQISAGRLKLILESQIQKKDLANIDYIDLRFGNKIFYKFKDE